MYRYIKKYHNIGSEVFDGERVFSRSLDIDVPSNKLIKINKVRCLIGYDGGGVSEYSEDMAIAICRVDKKRPVGIENFNVWSAYDGEILGVTTHLQSGRTAEFFTNELILFPENDEDNYSDVPRFLLYFKHPIMEVMNVSIVLDIYYDLIPITADKLSELERLKNLVGGSTQNLTASTLNDIGTIDLTP